MSIVRTVSSGVGGRFAGRPTGSLLEIDTWIPSEIEAITPLVERLMRLIKGSHCITGEEDAVELALREALNNAVVHGNRLDVRKLVHVRCRCRSGRGFLSSFQTRVKGSIEAAFPIPRLSRICWRSTDAASMS